MSAATILPLRLRVRRALAALACMFVLAGGAPPPATSGEATAVPFARADSLVVVVSDDAPVKSVPASHLVDIYLGRIQTFPDGSRAVPVDQASSSPARRVFYESFLERSLPEVKAHWSKLVFTGRGRPPREVPDGEAMVEFVAENPAAIGYADHRLVDDRVRVLKVN